MKQIQTLILLLIVSSCCMKESIEIARYELTADELELLPYTNEEKINFIHSNGYTFDFNVTENKVEWKEHHGFCEWNCCGNDYFSYQLKTTVLESSYPKFHVEFSLGGSTFGDYSPQVLNMRINHRHFIQFPYDSLAHFICDSVTKTVYYDSISLNNQMYYKVVMKKFDSHYVVNDSSALEPKSIYFNNLGMIQLEMSNYETYTINN